MRAKNNQPKIEELKDQLSRVRRASLEATRRGDYKTVAKLTSEAATLNKTLMEAEGLVLALQL